MPCRNRVSAPTIHNPLIGVFAPGRLRSICPGVAASPYDVPPVERTKRS